MFTDDIAQQLRINGYDVISVVADPTLAGLPDDQVLAYVTSEGRALVMARRHGPALSFMTYRHFNLLEACLTSDGAP